MTSGTKVRMSGAERREAILDAAADLLASLPYDALTMSDVVRAAGVSRPVVYDHFASKRELVIALITRHHELLVDELSTSLGEGAIATESDYRAVLDVVLGHFEQDPAGWRLLCNEQSSDPHVARVQRTTRDEILALTGAALALRPGSETELEALRHAINGLFAWQLEHPSVTREQLIDAAVALTWRGLGSGRRESPGSRPATRSRG